MRQADLGLHLGDFLSLWLGQVAGTPPEVCGPHVAFIFSQLAGFMVPFSLRCRVFLHAEWPILPSVWCLCEDV